QDLVHEAQLELTEAAAAQLRLQVCRPQALVLDLLLEAGGVRGVGLRREVRDLERQDLIADEAPHPLQLRLELRVGREIPAHWCLLLETRTHRRYRPCAFAPPGQQRPRIRAIM